MLVVPQLDKPVALGEVLCNVPVANASLRITSCTCDSRNVRRGGVFVAIRGLDDDGHHHLREAVARGCAAVIVESEAAVPEDLCVPCHRVDDTRQAYAVLCQALAGRPGEKLDVFAVTGTNGKTTTSCLIARVLAESGRPVGLVGTLGGFDGESFRDCSLTTPPAGELAAWLARMERNECTHAVIEASSHGIDQRRLDGVPLRGACITNIQRDHFDYHGSAEAYRRTKFRLLELLRPDGVAVVNVDDADSAALLAAVDRPVLTVGMRSDAQISGLLIERCLSEQTFLITAGSETAPVRTRMIGDHHIYNCLQATAIGLSQGIELTTIVRGLESLERIPGRLEPIDCGQPFRVFVDFAHTPDALRACLMAVRQATKGRLICVFGAGGDRDRGKRPLMGRTAECLADRVILTKNDPRSEDPQRIVADVLRGFKQPEKAILIDDRAEAIATALTEAAPEDCVVIAGKGHEQHHLIGGRAVPYSDRDTVRQWLAENIPPIAPDTL